MGYLHTADYIVIVVYFSILVCLGLYLRKKAAASLEDYFLGGKKLPWWALGISGMASFLDITGTMVITSFLFLLGPRGLYIAFRGGAVLVLVFMLIWAGKWHRRSNVITGAEWQVYRFGKGAGGQFARLVAAFAGMIFTIGMLAYMVKGVGMFLSTFVPGFSPNQCALVLIVIATIYTMVSGFYGVVFTDMFQSLIILVAVVFISILATQAISDYDGSLSDLAAEVTHNENWTSALPPRQVPMPEGYGDYSPLIMLTFFYLLKNVMMGIGGGGDPKYFGARNERECGVLTFLWTWLMMFRWPMMMGFAVLGVFLVKEKFPDQTTLSDSANVLKQYFVQQEYPNEPEAFNDAAIVRKVIPKEDWEGRVTDIIGSPEKHPQVAGKLKDLLGEEEWKPKLRMVGYEGWINPERILPAVLLFDIPRGFRGLLLIALIAASMSTFDSTVNATTGLFTRDVYQAHLRPRAGNRELIYASYAFGVIMVVGGFLLSMTTRSITDIWDWIIMGLTSGLVIPAILRLYWWRFNAGGVVIGTIVGLTAACVQRALTTLGYIELGPIEVFLVVTGIALVSTVVGTYLTPPTDPRTLEHFYKTTRPFGLWGPLKGVLRPKVRAIVVHEHRNDLMAIPFVLGWQVTLFLLPMLAIVRNFQAFWVALGIFVFCLLGMYKFWYKNLPPAREGVATEEEIDAGKL